MFSYTHIFWINANLNIQPSNVPCVRLTYKPRLWQPRVTDVTSCVFTYAYHTSAYWLWAGMWRSCVNVSRCGAHVCYWRWAVVVRMRVTDCELLWCACVVELSRLTRAGCRSPFKDLIQIILVTSDGGERHRHADWGTDRYLLNI